MTLTLGARQRSIVSRCLGQRRSLISAASLSFGQPLPETRPWMLQPVTPGIQAIEYHRRRANLAKQLPANSIAILSASDLKYRSGAVFYKYHQDADFLYLTGFYEPEALAVIEKRGNDEDHVFHLYVRPKDPKAELWEGARSGIQAAQDVFNGDEVGDIANVHKVLPDLIQSARHVYTDVPTTLPDHAASYNGQYLNGLAHWRTQDLPKLLRKSDRLTLHPLRKIMNELRVRKSEAEVANMLLAGVASGRAFTQAMRESFVTEADLQAFLEYQMYKEGCEGMAYVPVVAGGENALSIHYVRNDDALSGASSSDTGDAGFVLVDAGGQYGGYITDITRTWPTGSDNKFSKAQKDLYTAVLEPQKRLVSKCRADANLSLDDLHREAESSLRENLRALDFDVSGEAMSILFPHHVSHHIGLDVHDAPGFSRRVKLEPGMCVTVEPGIYVPDDERWPKWYRGMGIRIEDSICVQEDRPLVMTTEAIKEVSDIEDLGQI